MAKRYVTIVNYFRLRRFGSEPPVLAILSFLPLRDRCLILTEVLRGDPYNVTLHKKLSMAILKTGKLEDALEFLADAAQKGFLTWYDEQALREKILLLHEPRTEDYGSAATYYDTLAKIRDEWPKLHSDPEIASLAQDFVTVLTDYCVMEIADNEYAQDPSEDPIDVEKLVEKADFNAMLLGSRGMQLYREGKLDESVAAFTQAISSMPDNSNWPVMRGTVYQDMRRYDLAESDFRETLIAQPTDWSAMYRLGMNYWFQRMAGPAVEWLSLSLRRAPDEDLERTVGTYRSDILMVSKQVIAYNLANIMLQLGKVDEALRLCEEALQVSPEYPYPWLVRGLALIRKGNQAEGNSALQKAAALGLPQALEFIDIGA